MRPQPRAVAWLQLRGVAWPVVGALSAVAAVAGAAGIAWRDSAPALLPIAFALLAAAAAFLLDEPASEVVDVTPTGPAHPGPRSGPWPCWYRSEWAPGWCWPSRCASPGRPGPP